MEERKDSSEGTRNVLKVIVILAFLVGAFFFGQEVWKIEFEHTWKRYTALVIGEITFLYSYVFLVTGIAMVVMYFSDREENDWGMKSALIILCLAAIFQLVFWGILYAYSEAFKIAGILLLIIIVLAVWLKQSLG